MARIRFAHNSFSTGLVSKKVQGNTEFEGYNNSLDECTNFQVMHTGGVIKRGGTIFVANTKYNKPVRLFPFIYSALESYMCEFGDLEDRDRHKGTKNTNLSDDAAAVYGYPKGLKYNADGFIVDSSGRLMERGYIRFYTAAGVARISDLYVPFTLEDLKTGHILQEGNLINVVTKIGLYRIIRENNFKFRITAKDDYVNSPKTFSVNAPVYLKPTVTHDTNGKYEIIVQNASSDEDPIEEKYYGAIKASDKGSFLYLKYMLDNGMAFYCLTITNIEFDNARPHKIKAEIYPKFCINCLKDTAGSSLPGAFKFPDDLATLNWSVSAFTEERGYPEAAALYERRLFLASNKEYPTGIWGSSMQFDNTMDFTPDNTNLSALQVKMGSQYTDKILWMIGQSRIFIGTNGGIFMAGAPDDKAQMSTANISVRMFDAVSVSPLPPVAGGDSVFFVDSSEKNVHEIILSSETGMYKANDVSLLANELTTSGIVSHCWTQHPIKTYWCVTKAGHLCALTYLKNNGILAWSKHELAGGAAAKVECVSSMKHDGEDHLWMCVNRNKASGEDNRQIEYMSHSYNSRDVEDCQHYLDSGKSKTDEIEIVKIDTSVHTQVRGDFRFVADIITRRRNCSVIFEHIVPAVDNILNKNISFFIQNPSETGACILRDFTYEQEHTDADGNQLSPRNRGMIDPSTFGEVTDASSKREYYYEVASIEDFRLNNVNPQRLKLDSVDHISIGDLVIIFAWENAGLESISTKRDPEANTTYNIFKILTVDTARSIVTLDFPQIHVTGYLKSGKLYKLSDKRMTGYVLGKETEVTCKAKNDDINWKEMTMPSAKWSSVCYGYGQFVAVAFNSNLVACSTDGINWKEATMPFSRVWQSVCYGIPIEAVSGQFVAVAYGSDRGAYSTDGINWKEVTLPFTGKWQSVCYGIPVGSLSGRFVAVAGGVDKAVHSSDGIVWKEATMPFSSVWQSVCYGGGKFVAVAGSDKAAYSTDGINWKEVTLPFTGNWQSVCYGGGKFVAVAGTSNQAMYSTDGIKWISTIVPFREMWTYVCYGHNKFVAVAGSMAAYSPDGITWTAMPMPFTGNWQSVCYGGGKFVAVVSGSKGCFTWPGFTINDKVQLDSVSNMKDICNTDYIVKQIRSVREGYIFTFHDHWFVNGVLQPLDTCDKADYEIVGGNDARMLHYFDCVTGLDHLEGEEVTVISNGKTFKSIVTNGTVQAGKNGEETLFCSVGLQFTASLKTVPLSGGNVTGSSVGCVGSQRSMVLHLFESWGGTYGTSEGEKRPIPYPKTAEAIFNESEGLFTGTVKCPVINGDPTNRCIYIQHNEPTAFSVISMVQDVQVSDA